VFSGGLVSVHCYSDPYAPAPGVSMRRRSSTFHGVLHLPPIFTITPFFRMSRLRPQVPGPPPFIPYGLKEQEDKKEKGINKNISRHQRKNGNCMVQPTRSLTCRTRLSLRILTVNGRSGSISRITPSPPLCLPLPPLPLRIENSRRRIGYLRSRISGSVICKRVEKV
jgi:hypothetical protein